MNTFLRVEGFVYERAIPCAIISPQSLQLSIEIFSPHKTYINSTFINCHFDVRITVQRLLVALISSSTIPAYVLEYEDLSNTLGITLMKNPEIMNLMFEAVNLYVFAYIFVAIVTVERNAE
ncbi:hypothetical protein Tcan_00908, partial [Toxocara canis]